MKKVPKRTPLKETDLPVRVKYAQHGPILNGGQFGCVVLSHDWDVRKKEIGFGDHKPWWIDSSSANNRYYYSFDDQDPPEFLNVDKHSPHFMNFCAISWHGRCMYYHSKKVKNKRRSRNSQGDLVEKYHFEHEKVDSEDVVRGFESTVIPWLKKTGIKLFIMDNDTKLHSKKLCDLCEKNGIQIYPGGGKTPWDRQENGYPPRSHDCQPAETEFANTFEESQLDVERREKNANKKRTMVMWKNELDKTWDGRPVEEIYKLIERQPRIMKEIIEKEGERTSY